MQWKHAFQSLTRFAALAGLAVSMPMLYGQTVPKIQKVPVRPVTSVDGKDLFVEYCAVCHGADAKGQGPAATALKKAPADLTQIAHRNGGTFNQLAVQDTIGGQDTVAAHGSRDMPVWGPVFRSNTDPAKIKLVIFNLATYIQGLQAK